MTTDHRGTPVGGNHRPTPRIALLLAHEMGNPSNRKFLRGAIPSEYREETAQNLINSHRAGVAKGVGGSDATSLISNVVKNRHEINDNMNYYYDTGKKVYLGDEDTMGSRGDDGKSDYLFDHPDDPPRGY